MASKTIKTILSLQDKNFSSGMSKASKGVGSFGNRLKHSSNNVKRFKKNTVRSFKSVVKSAAGLAVAYMGIRATVQGVNESVEAAKAQLSVEKKLETVLKQRTNATDEQIQSIHALTVAQQELGIIGDEVQMAGAQQVATFVKETKSVETLLPAMNNLLAQQKGVNATQQDAVNIGNMVGKVLNGQTGALTRVGISFSDAQKKMLKHGNEQERSATLAQIITDNIGGMNKALAETDEGKIKNMTNRWGDYKEEIGKKILPLQAEFAGWFATKIPGIQKRMTKMIDRVSLGINRFKDIGVNAYDRVKKAIDDNRPTIDYLKDRVELLGYAAIDVKNWFVDAFANIKQRVEENQPTIEGVRDVLSDMGNKAVDLKDYMKEAFEAAEPAIEWLKTDGLPNVVDGIADLTDKAIGFYNFVDENWNLIGPIVLGIAAAVATYKTGLLILTGVTKATTLATSLMTGAQTAFNAVLNLSPLGWAAIAIGVLVTAGIALYKNWDTVKEKANDLWVGIKAAFSPLEEFFTTMFTSTKEGFKSFVNFFIDGINTVVEGMNGIKVEVPDWVPKIGGESWGVNIPKIPNFALGTSYFQGGLARINEGGRGEMVSLPNGSQVIPADKSEKIIEKRFGNKVYNTININGANMTIQQILNELIPQLKLVMENI